MTRLHRCPSKDHHSSLLCACGLLRAPASSMLLGMACDTLTVGCVCRTPSQAPCALDGKEFDEWTSGAKDQLEARNASGQTPLLVAAGNGLRRVATLLLKHGADITAKDCNGQDALDLAREDNQDMLSLLQNGPEGTGEAGERDGAPRASQAEASMEEQEGAEAESEEEDPIAAALAKAAAAVAKADADHAADAVALRRAAGPRSGVVVRSSGSLTEVTSGDSSRAAGGASHGDGRVGSNAFASVVDATKTAMESASNEEPDAIVEVSTYAANVREKRAALGQSRGGSSSLGVASMVSRKPQPPGDIAAQADQAVQVCNLRHHSGCLNGSSCNDTVCLAVC